MNTDHLFRRDFTLVVIGQIISLFGSAILRFALPLYLLRQTGFPAQFGLVGAASMIPAVLCSPVGGVAADRLNKRSMMAGLDFFTAGLVLAFALLLDRVPLLPLMAACLMLLYGIAGAYQPAVQASIPLLAGAEQLTRANAVINMVNTLSALLGPVAGGVLFSQFGIRPILWVSIGCFLSSAVMELFIHIPHTPQKAAGGLLAAGQMEAALLPGLAPALGYWMMTAASFAVMVLSTVLVVMLSAAVQSQTPASLLGKVMAFIMAVSNCAAPLGQAVYGVLFQCCPAWAVLLGAAVCAGVIGAWARGAFRRLEEAGGTEG